jgi:hypothetical protein
MPNPTTKNSVELLTQALEKNHLRDTITFENLESKIQSLMTSFNNAKRTLTKSMRSILEDINYYLSNPSHVLRANYFGGINALREKYSTQLLRLNVYNHPTQSILLSNKQAALVNHHFTRIAQVFKVKQAYKALLSGKKFQKAKLKARKSDNPIQYQSRRNLKKLIFNLKSSSKGSKNLHGLMDDEITLFEVLLNLPISIQHATNHFYPIQSAGSLASYTEIQRFNPDYKSAFSTPGNIEKLGNGGFVFFRVFVDGANGNETRYGSTSLVSDISLLCTGGWISLHDQLNPFPSHSPNTRRFYWHNRLLRASKVVSIHSDTKDDSLKDGLQYTYRQAKIYGYNGKKDIIKEFGSDEDSVTTQTRSFLSEMFFGDDIRLGISLATIYELRQLDKCGFRKHFIGEFTKTSKNKRNKLVGDLIRSLFRIEGKLPVAVKPEVSLATNIGFFTSTPRSLNQVNRSAPVTVVNPEGDGRYSIDLTENIKKAKSTSLRDRKKEITDKLSVARRQVARFRNNKKQKENHKKWSHELKKLNEEFQRLNVLLEDDMVHRQELIAFFVHNYSIDESVLRSINNFKLDLIQTYFDGHLDCELVTLVDLINTRISILILITNQNLMKLLEDEEISFAELTTYTETQLEVLKEYDISLALDKGYTLDELLSLYSEDSMHLDCLCCDDITDLVLEQAPDIHPIVMEYAIDFDVDFDFILESLCDSDSMQLRITLGHEDADDGYTTEPEYSDGDVASDQEDYGFRL